LRTHGGQRAGKGQQEHGAEKFAKHHNLSYAAMRCVDSNAPRRRALTAAARRGRAPTC
jgi:hypothetical protein